MSSESADEYDGLEYEAARRFRSTSRTYSLRKFKSTRMQTLFTELSGAGDIRGIDGTILIRQYQPWANRLFLRPNSEVLRTLISRMLCFFVLPFVSIFRDSVSESFWSQFSSYQFFFPRNHCLRFQPFDLIRNTRFSITVLHVMLLHLSPLLSLPRDSLSTWANRISNYCINKRLHNTVSWTAPANPLVWMHDHSFSEVLNIHKSNISLVWSNYKIQ